MVVGFSGSRFCLWVLGFGVVALGPRLIHRPCACHVRHVPVASKVMSHARTLEDGGGAGGRVGWGPSGLVHTRNLTACGNLKKMQAIWKPCSQTIVFLKHGLTHLFCALQSKMRVSL